jgi:Rrf2 family nitric oxide-sensitive transcriptional repressor
MDLVECFDPGTSHCRIEAACGLRGVLEEALDTFLGTLDRYTLADLIVRRRRPLDRLFAPS